MPAGMLLGLFGREYNREHNRECSLFGREYKRECSLLGREYSRIPAHVYTCQELLG